MLCEWWLSQRYLKKGKKETIISVTAIISMLGIAVGVFVLIVVISVMSGFDRFLQEKMIGANSDLTVELMGGTNEPYKLTDEVSRAPHVVAAAPMLAGQAFMKSRGTISAVELRGVDPVLQEKVSRFGEYLRKGTFDISGDEIVIGEELAARLGVGVGDTVAFISPVSLEKTDFKVAGIFNSGMYLYDSGLAITSLAGAQGFFRAPGYVTSVAVKVDDAYQADAVRHALATQLAPGVPFDVRTWEDTNRNFLEALKLEKTVMYIVVTMTTVVAAFGIVSTLIMSVMNKTKDIGILRSVGARTASIIQIFVFQGLSIGVTGIILGVVGGVYFAKSLNRIVDALSHLIGRELIPRDIYYFDRIPTYLGTWDVTFIVASALVITLAASFYPAWYAARVNPSEALRHE